MQASKWLVCIAGLTFMLAGLFAASVRHGERSTARGPARAPDSRAPEVATAGRDLRPKLVGSSQADVARTPLPESDEGIDRGGARSFSKSAVATGSVATGELAVLACDREDRPIAGIELTLQACSDAGAWRVMRSGRTDVEGRLVFSMLAQDPRYRVQAPGGVVADAPAITAAEVVRLSLDRPREAKVELRTADGYALAGARRVEFHPGRSADGPRIVLSPARRPAQWCTSVALPVEGTLRVTDSLGRVWSTPHTLAPDETGAATPGSGWVAIAPTVSPGTATARAFRPGRFRWTLRLGNGAERRGSSRLAPDGGFHAVVDRQQARAFGGHLELRWSSGAGERRLQASWYADSALAHIAMPPSPVGEEVSLSTSNL